MSILFVQDVKELKWSYLFGTCLDKLEPPVPQANMTECASTWCIDWNVLFTLLSHCPGDKRRYGDYDFMSRKLKIINKKSNLDLIESSIRWLDNDYIGYCRPYLYPHVAFLGVQDIDNFNQLPSADHSNSNSNRKVVGQEIGMIFDQSGLTINSIKKNDLKDLLLSLSSNLNHWRKEHSLFDTSIIRKDSKRISSLTTNEFLWLWKFGSLNVFADPIDEKMIAINTNANGVGGGVGWHDEYFFDKTMYIEVSVVLGWDSAGKNETNILTNRKNKFLCVFSDGTTVYASYHYYGVPSLLIQCNVTDNLKLKYSIYSQTFKKYKQRDKLNIKNNIDTDTETVNNIFASNIGLTIFAIFPKRDNDHLFHEFIVSTNVQLPVCAHMQVNRKPKIYTSEWDYHFNTNNKGSSLHTSIKFYNETDLLIDNGHNRQHQQQQSQEEQQRRRGQGQQHSKTFEPKYYLSGVSAVSPSRKSGQMDIITLQWVDYHLFQGFDHFFIYDHLELKSRADLNNTDYFYKLFKQDYIDKGYVTLIEWPFTKRENDMWTFEYAAYLDSYRRFGYDTKFVYTGDCDEFLIPKPNRSITVSVTPFKRGPDETKRFDNGFDFNFADVEYLNIIEKEMINVKEIVIANNEIEHYDGFDILTYPALPNAIKFWMSGYIDGESIYVPPTPSPIAKMRMLGKETGVNQHQHQDPDQEPHQHHIDSATEIEKLDGPQHSSNRYIDSNNNNNHVEDSNSLYSRSGVKQLGCNKDKIENRFNTFFERQSCLHYVGTSSMENYETLMKLSINNKKRIAKEKMVLENNGINHKAGEDDDEDVDGNNNNKNNNNDNDNDNNSNYTFMFNGDKSRMRQVRYRLNQGTKQHGRNVYEVNPKIIVEAKKVLFGYFHSYYTSRLSQWDFNKKDNNEYNKYLKSQYGIRFKNHQYNDELAMNYTRQYDMFVFHARDHWNKIAERRSLKSRQIIFQFHNPNDMKYFYSFTQNNCDFQNIILYWNKRFLQSKFGTKWKNKTLVDPLVDKDGVFCYLKRKRKK